jgi:hypothetical protein
VVEILTATGREIMPSGKIERVAPFEREALARAVQLAQRCAGRERLFRGRLGHAKCRSETQ